MYELNADEIDMVAGGGSLSNLFGAIVSLLLTPVVSIYNGVATTVYSLNSTLATNGKITTADVISSVVQGVNSAGTTFVAGLNQVSQGAAGAKDIISAIQSTVAFNALTSPTLNLIGL
jgi:hypothetical protein